MKALCAAVIVLSFISVGQPAPLTCDTLKKPVEKGPNLSGRWYYIAISTEVCLPTTLLDSIIWPSFSMDVTSKDTPNLYDGLARVKMYGYCVNESESALYVNNKIYDVDSENAPTGDPDVLLHTSCHDCLAVKTDDVIDSLVLLSRRSTVTTAELQEFKKQVECFGWSKPVVLNTDHDFNNCLTIDDNMTEEAAEHFLKNFFPKMIERIKNTHHNIFKCLSDMVAYYGSSPFALK
ncbi:uncharacterized protein LOC119411880 [Nematolebias whitei]|uniref:uncharacterized protein LOC119411880 n=1 Tax=Nematolebias whitei TaxID=451745 RepID=UPI0018984845|nr:uncharacterized protein LOC119411880 [Nematolebias whitei]